MRRKLVQVGRWYVTPFGFGEVLTVEPEITIRIDAPPKRLPLTVTPRQVEREVPEARRQETLIAWNEAAWGGGGGHTHGR